MRSVCADNHLPEKATVLWWVVTGREIDGTKRQFSDQYHAAREAAGYSHADEALDMRHMVYAGQLEPNAAKVILDSLKWGAERMAPKRHSQRQEIDHTTAGEAMKPVDRITVEVIGSDATEDPGH